MKKFFALMFAGCSTTSEESPKVKEIKQRREEEKQLAEQKVAELNATAEKVVEEKRLTEQKVAEEKRIAEAKTAEQKAQEEARKQAEREAAEERRRQEQAAQVVAEQNAFQNWESKINFGISAVDDHWENLWQYTLNSASSGAMDAQTVFQNLRELEHRLIDDEMIFQNATVPQEMSQTYATK